MDKLYRKIIEGETELFVPKELNVTKDAPVFYNPEMELSRDLSVAFVKTHAPKTVCDLLSGSGARGIRIAKETGVDVLCNDANPLAYETMKKNAELNDVKVELTNLEGNRLLSERFFDYIDIDPFGSPTRLLDSAVRAVTNKGVIALTATDTSALCGSSPKACVRKYDAMPLRSDCYNEIGLRILLGSVARAAAKYNRGIQPLFSHCTRHYFRAYIKINRGPGNTTKSLKNVGYLQHCMACLFREYKDINSLSEKCPVCGGALRNAGPLWKDTFADKEFCVSLAKTVSEMKFGKSKPALKLINTVSEEQNVVLPYYNIHKVASRNGKASQALTELAKEVKDKGFEVYRTHFCNLGLRTKADYNILKDAI
jgi:tRNA (guanine26-N2/guanine27-N2)-dimethyltransferase